MRWLLESQQIWIPRSLAAWMTASLKNLKFLVIGEDQTNFGAIILC
jgi:hypothetical protein